MLAHRCRLVEQRLRSCIDAGKAQRQPPDPSVRARLEADHAALPPEKDLSGGEDQLEAQDDSLRPWLRANERYARAREQIELLLEILLLASVGSSDADRDGRTRIVGHESDATTV